MGLNGPGPKKKSPLLALVGSARFRLAPAAVSSLALPCRRLPLSLVPRAPRTLAAVRSPFPLSAVLIYTPGEGTVTSTGGGPPTRSRARRRWIIPSRIRSQFVLGLCLAWLGAALACSSGASVNRRVGGWVLSSSSDPLFSISMGGSESVALCEEAAARPPLASSSPSECSRYGRMPSLTSPCSDLFGFWVLSSRNLCLDYDRFPSCSTSAFSS